MEPGLTFEKACILAQELGQAESQSQLLRAAVPAVAAPPEGVLKVEQGPKPARSRGQRGGAPLGRGGQQNQPRCWRCGRGHSPDSCVVRTWECRRCGRKGHIAKVCRMDSARIHGVDGRHDGVAAEGVSLEDEGGINGIHSTGFQAYFADL
ncbi:uncharacterized protein LOC124165169 [Ischnura elegans]|uniref:uncharacterized protein LOC124165169 n=1 Tax=Ischnura elegans TaxID=197161 RepID=UPI001ED87499|nr:uncharacterized protein LOC124165169 [Ischnura elegans]